MHKLQLLFIKHLNAIGQWYTLVYFCNIMVYTRNPQIIQPPTAGVSALKELYYSSSICIQKTCFVCACRLSCKDC